MKKYLLNLLATTTLFLFPIIAQAQIYQPSNRIPVADNSQIGTQVSGTNNQFNIDGGLQRGQNLFHSFTDFSVPTGGSANFTNSVGNQSIITRVTGNLYSDLNGLIKTNGANFLLINPNGVVFGEGVSLDVGKAFVTSTASGVDFVDAQGKSYNFGVNQAGDVPLINIDPTVAFNPAKLIFNNSIPGSKGIENYGTIQTQNDGQYIGLIGGDIKFNGGKIIAPGGRVDIGGLTTAGTVSVNSDGLLFNGTNLIRSNVSIANNSSISVRGKQTLNPVGSLLFANAISPGSTINISANQIDIINSGSRFISSPNNSINQALGGLDAGLDVNSGTKTGSIGNISMNATGDINIKGSAIFNLIRSGAQGTGGGINITGNNVNVIDKSEISTTLSKDAIGSGGDINITAKGNFNFFQPNYPDATISLINVDTESIAQALISTSTYGKGNAGNIKIAAGGDVVISDNTALTSTVAATGVGNTGNIKIDGKTLTVRNGGQILTSALAPTPNSPIINTNNNAGNIDINTTGDVSIFGSKKISEDRNNSTRLARIESNNFRKGDTGKITINTPGKVSILNRGAMISSIRGSGNGKAGGVTLNVGELLIGNLSEISSSIGGRNAAGQRESNTKGKAGDINITATGDITINEYLDSLIAKKFNNNATAPSGIYSSILGQATDAEGKPTTELNGKITITTLGKVSVGNHDAIVSSVEREGDGSPGGVEINARELEVFNAGQILTVAARYRNGSDSTKKGNSGNITIKTSGNVTIAGNIDPAVGKDNDTVNIAKIASNSFRNGNAGKITIDSGGTVSLFNKGGLVTQCLQDCSSQTSNTPGNITINSKQLNLDRGDMSTSSTDKGGNIIINTQESVLMRRRSQITTDSKGTGEGGNIVINSKFLLATNANNDITANADINANKGKGGTVKIDAQGVFGIEFRPKPNNNTSDITATGGLQSGDVKINTLGIDPGKDKGELPAAPNDASNQIAQACGSSQRDSKFYLTGRGGLPPNASEAQESDALWVDARATNQPTPIAQQPAQLSPPAIGWVFGTDGRVSLIAAQTNGGAGGSQVVCPNKSNK
jgi:filamentous hemagglutinin family protein